MTDGYTRDLRICDVCGGTGAIRDSDETGYNGDVIPCPQCDGEGYYL